MKKAAMAFSGPSNSGKTTLILKVAKKFIDDGLKVVIVKHDPSNKARFNQIGADVAVMSPTRTTFFSQESKSIEDVVKMAGEFDLLLVEGLKTLPLPRISVFKDEINEDYLSFSNAIASYKKDYVIDKPNFDLDDTQAICEWILKNAKVLK